MKLFLRAFLLATAGALLPGAAPSEAVLLGTLDTPGTALDVEVDGSLAFVADGSAGLRIVDVSDPQVPIEIGFLDTPGSASGVEVVGTLAYVADGASGVRVIDVSDPSTPLELGALDTPGTALDVEVTGSLALIADGTGGFRVLDVSNPAAPFQVGQANQNVKDVEVVGTLAYAAVAVGLRVYDFTNPAAPFVARAYNNQGVGVGASGALAFLASGASYVDVIDTIPSPPVVLGHMVANMETVSDVEVVGSHAYVSDRNYVRTFDFSNPASPVWIDTPGLLFGTGVLDAAISDPYLYAVSSVGLAIFGPPVPPVCSNDLDDDDDGFVDFPDDPGCQFATSSLEDPRCQDGIDNDDQLGTDFDAGESILGVGNGDPDGPDPQCRQAWKNREEGGTCVYPCQPGCGLGFELAPVLGLLAWRRRSRAQRLAGRGTLKDARSREGTGMRSPLRACLVSIAAVLPCGSVSAETSILGSLTFSANALDVELDYPLAYVAAGSAGLRVVDVSEPTSPLEIGAFDTPGSATSVELAGDLAYVADGAAGVRILDVSDPTAPVEIGAFDTPGSARDVEVSGSLALVADQAGGLRILDVSNPAAPVQVGQHTTQTVYDVEVVGTLAHAATDRGLRVYNFTVPAYTFVARTYNTNAGVSVETSGSLSFLLTGLYEGSWKDLRVIDTAPQPAVQITSVDVADTARNLELVGTLAYVVHNDSIPIYDVSDPAAPVPAGHVYDVWLITPTDIAVGDPYFYVTDGQKLHVLGDLPCSDGLDNDGDGLVDFPDDPGCVDAEGIREDPECQNGSDDDGDGVADFPGDPGCPDPTANLEDPACQDGIDNDGNPGTDFDGGESALGAGNGDPDGPDPDCAGEPWRDKETGGPGIGPIGPCGLGFELAPVLAVLAWRRRRGR